MAVTRIKNNQITDLTVNAAAKLQDYSVTSGKIANNLIYGSNLTVTGNLTVQGNVTTIDTHDLVVEDPLILLAKDQTGSPTLDIGYIGQRGTELNIAWIWDESADEFAGVYTSDYDTNTTVTINSYANLHVLDITASNANITGNITFSGNIIGDFSITGNVDAGNFITTGNVDAGNVNITNELDANTANITGDVYIGGNIIAPNSNLAFQSGTFYGDDPTGNNAIYAGVANFTPLGSNVIAQFTGNVNAYSQVNFQNINSGNLASTDLVATADDGDDDNFYVNLGINSSTFDDPIDYPGFYPHDAYVHNHGGNLILNPETANTVIKLMVGGTDNSDVVATVSTTGIDMPGNLTAGNVFINAAFNSDTISANTITGGNIWSSGNIQGANLVANAGVYTNTVSATSITATGNIDGANVIASAGVFGNTVLANTITATVEVIGANVTANNIMTANVVNSNTASVLGNITGGNLISNAAIIGNALTINGNANITGNTSVTGNVDAANLIASAGVFSDTVLANTITATVDVIGANVTANNIMTANVVNSNTASVLGNITGGNLISNAAIVGNALTVNGDALVTGNLTIEGNLTYINIDDLRVEDPIIMLGTGANGNVLVTNDGRDRGTELVYYSTTNTQQQSAFMGWDNSTGNMLIAANVTVANDVVTVVEFGTFEAGNTYLESLSVSGNITAANLNVTVNIASATITASGNITGNNIISNNDVTTATVTASGNISANNISANNDITSVTVTATGNLVGGNANITSGVYSATVTATGNIIGNNVTANDTVYSTTIIASGNVTGNNITSNNNISTITLDASGNIVGSNITANNDVTATTVTATGNLVGGNANITSGVYSATVTATGNIIGNNITANDTIYSVSITASGNITGNNLSSNNNISTITLDASGNVLAANLNSNSYVTGIEFNASGNIIGANLNSNNDVSTVTLTASGNISANNAIITLNLGADTVTANAVTANNSVTANTFIANTSANIGNIRIAGNDITSVGGIVTVNTAGDDIDFRVSGNNAANLLVTDAGTDTVLVGTATPTVGASFKVGTTDSLLVPVGNTAQRPGSPVQGMLRFNTTLNDLEFYDNDSWNGTKEDLTVIVVNSFIGDNSTVVFSLSQDSTTASTIVSINGIVQIPTTAYAVSGNVLTFTEPPADGDQIDCRLLSTTTEVVRIQNTPGNAIIEVDTAISEASITANVTYFSGEILPTGNAVANIGSAANLFNRVWAVSTSAVYSDLAEMYRADADYEPGTVLSFGGTAEVTSSMTSGDTRVAGVVSTQPSYLMNSSLDGEHVVALALTGRVPTKVTGAVRKGDMMVSNGDGTARAESNPSIGSVIGKSLEDFSGSVGVIEVVVGRL